MAQRARDRLGRQSFEDRYGERFSRPDAAAILGVTIRTLDRWVSARIIGHVRLGGRVYITGAQLDEFWRNSERTAWVQPELPFEEAS